MIEYLNKEQELELVRLYQVEGNNEALKLLLKNHLNYIRKLCNKVSKAFRGQVEDDDLHQAAFVGFLNGLNRFDRSKGTRVMTYVHWHIMSELFQAYSNAMPLHIPAHRLRNMCWRTDKQLAEEMNRIYKSIASVEQLQRSYDDTNSDDIFMKPSEFGTAVDNTFEAVQKYMLPMPVENAINDLPAVQRDVFWLRAGLDMGGRYRIPEIAEKIGISIHDVELELQKAKRRLRVNPAIQRLKESV